MSERAERLRQDIKREVSAILQRELKDPRLGFISVTDVEVSRDLSHVKIYVSVFGDDTQKENSMKGLENGRGHIRSLLASRLRVRHVPAIQFRYDQSLEHGARINQILRRLNSEGDDE